MPRNYTEQKKIDIDFQWLNSEAENTSQYEKLISFEHTDIAKEAKLFFPPLYRLIRIDDDAHSFQIALLSDVTKEIVYYIKCNIIEDIYLNAKPVTQVLLWRTSVISHLEVTSGIAGQIFRNYLLERYNIVASDSCQTREGRDFWVRQLGYALAFGEHVYRFHRITCELEEILEHSKIRDNSADLWGDEEEYEHILALISKEPLPVKSDS